MYIIYSNINIHVLFAFWDSHFWKTVTVTVTVFIVHVFVHVWGRNS